MSKYLKEKFKRTYTAALRKIHIHAMFSSNLFDQKRITGEL